MLQLDDKPCENCGRMLKAVNPQKGAAYFYPCACNRPVQTGMGVTYLGSQEHDLILAGGAWNLNDLMTAQPQKWLQLNVENGPCQHSRRQGDNYGVTCMECGETIAGYGFWGEGSKTCIHEWGRMDDESKEEMCIYCQVYRPAQPKPVLHQWRKGDLGRVNNHLVLFLEEERSIWVSQGGIAVTGLRHRLNSFNIHRCSTGLSTGKKPLSITWLESLRLILNLNLR